MSRGLKAILALSMVCSALPAVAEERDFCAARPGQATPPCTVEPGRVVAEIGLGDWTHDRNADQSKDMVSLGNILLRTGISQTAEVQLGWTAFGSQIQRDRFSGARTHESGVGDVTLAVQQDLGKVGGPAAVRAFVTLPTGSGPLAAGDWGAGAMLPLAFNLTSRLELDLTPEIDAAVNSSGNGRHLAYGSVIGLGLDLHHHLSLAVDAAFFRDQDPSGHNSRETGGVSLAWMAGRNLQLDVGTIFGLNADSTDVEAYFGLVRRF